MSQKKPVNQIAFLTGAETNINLAIRRMTDALNTGGTLGMTFFCLCEKRTKQDKQVFPSLFQSNSKDIINLLANDMWPGYGFWDADDPTKYEGGNPENEISRNRYSVIKRQVALVVYGNMDKLKPSTNIDYRYFKQQIQDEIVRILSRELSLMSGTFNIQSVFQNKIEDIFKGYTLDEAGGQYLQYPMFGFRFEGELIVKEQCTPASTIPITLGMGVKTCQTSVVSDTAFTVPIPAGMMLLYIQITSDKSCQVSFGTTSGGTEIVAGMPVVAGENTLTVEQVFDLYSPTYLFVNDAGAGDDWNAATLQICYIYRSI